MSNPIVTFEMENGKTIKAELYPEIAPNTVNNFLSLVNKGYYDGLTFHRVIYGFMIQGGCPEGTGMGGPGYSIKGEFAVNGFENNLKHTEGVLSMARSMMPDSAGSQFFIMQKTLRTLTVSMPLSARLLRVWMLSMKSQSVTLTIPTSRLTRRLWQRLQPKPLALTIPNPKSADIIRKGKLV